NRFLFISPSFNRGRTLISDGGNYPWQVKGACTCSMIPLAADSDPRDETILQRRLFEAMSFVGSSTEDLPGLIGLETVMIDWRLR
ncbi:hypothetical protein NKJ74_32040, partial [Mesorhizobium sp. M0046]|uniref:hypothetical protein n=1 Tax=Mesorhizobium sp. M0046 TaxID=2956858 RepID=UPI003338D038